MRLTAGLLLFSVVIIMCIMLTGGQVMFWDLFTLISISTSLAVYYLIAKPFSKYSELSDALTLSTTSDLRVLNRRRIFFKGLMIYATFSGIMHSVLAAVILTANGYGPYPIGPGISVAILSTFYGLVLSSVFYCYYQNCLTQLNDLEEYATEHSERHDLAA
ncbi:MAG: MotA/TolQ/ExbB proton channel family protein [Pseudobacteriovorax sp.]|nr:MotA/TolQ/ExbB proton channel family protein [Pseudobacteriovorax sp.]